MTLNAILLAVVTICGMASGQLFFKLAAGQGTLIDVVVSRHFCVAIALMGIATVSWVLLLRDMDLSRAYPIMALSYVVVPLASAVLFGERLDWVYAVGVCLIVAGLMLTRLT